MRLEQPAHLDEEFAKASRWTDLEGLMLTAPAITCMAALFILVRFMTSGNGKLQASWKRALSLETLLLALGIMIVLALGIYAALRLGTRMSRRRQFVEWDGTFVKFGSGFLKVRSEQVKRVTLTRKGGRDRRLLTVSHGDGNRKRKWRLWVDDDPAADEFARLLDPQTEAHSLAEQEVERARANSLEPIPPRARLWAEFLLPAFLPLLGLLGSVALLHAHPQHPFTQWVMRSLFSKDETFKTAKHVLFFLLFWQVWYVIPTFWINSILERMQFPSLRN